MEAASSKVGEVAARDQGNDCENWEKKPCTAMCLWVLESTLVARRHANMIVISGILFEWYLQSLDYLQLHSLQVAWQSQHLLSLSACWVTHGTFWEQWLLDKTNIILQTTDCEWPQYRRRYCQILRRMSRFQSVLVHLAILLFNKAHMINYQEQSKAIRIEN